jgi:hypothetical protein
MSIVIKTHCIQPDRKESAKMNAHGTNSLESSLKARQPEAFKPFSRKDLLDAVREVFGQDSGQ